MRGLAAVLLLGLTSCGPTMASGAGAGGGGGSGGSSGRGGGSPWDGGSIDPMPDALNCGPQDLPLQRLAPDLLIALDRSVSMDDSPPAGGGSKWSQVTAAIDQTVMTSQADIRWGIEFFPTDNSCGAGQIIVPVAAMNYTPIANAIAVWSPGGRTPTHDAVHYGAMYLASIPDQNPKYLLLATDGEPNCVPGALSDPDDARAEQAVTDAANMGIPTFVIGIAADSSADAVLNQMAQNGGEPRAGGPPYYYPVGSQAELVQVIDMIAGGLVSCTFPLSGPPFYPDLVTVTVDGVRVPRDPTHMNGWDYGPGNLSIQFYGMWCTGLGSASSVHAVFDCPPIGIRR